MYTPLLPDETETIVLPPLEASTVIRRGVPRHLSLLHALAWVVRLPVYLQETTSGLYVSRRDLIAQWSRELDTLDVDELSRRLQTGIVVIDARTEESLLPTRLDDYDRFVVLLRLDSKYYEPLEVEGATVLDATSSALVQIRAAVSSP